VFVFAGRKPTFPLPSFEFWSDEELLAWRLRPRTLPCHPHIAVASGLDVAHWATVHRFEITEEPTVRVLDAHRVQAQVHLRLPPGTGASVLDRLGGNRISATFTSWGGNMATIEGWMGRLPVLVWISHEPRPDGRSLREALMLTPRLRRAPGWLKLEKAFLALAELALADVLKKNRALIESMDLESDPGPAHALFVQQIEAMRPFDPHAAPEPDPEPAPLAMGPSSGETF
jgi:hypothetical protein